MIVGYASMSHYAEHLRPILAELGDQAGPLHGPRARCPWGPPLQASTLRNARAVLVAGYSDLQRVQASGARVVYVEHGAGQSYDGDPAGAGDPSFSGGAGHRGVALYLAPSDRVAERWRATYPHVPAVAVGCPKLDPWHRADQPRPHVRPPVVAITWHWDCPLVPETRTALPHYLGHLGRLVDGWRAQGWEVWGHAHPRAWGTVHKLWAQLGVTRVEHLASVFTHASVLVADNTSALYEFASLDRPVVVLNAPWYRRDVHHGLRFWNLVPGTMVDGPHQLADVDLQHQLDSPTVTWARRGVVRQVYAATDGQAAARAARAIVNHT